MPRDAEPPNDKVVQPDENLDVVRTSHDRESVEPKGPAGESALDQHLSVVCPFPAQPSRQRKPRGNYRTRGTKYISATQAANIVEAVAFAKSIGVPLVAHLTIHWSGTVAFDDHDGTRFAKVRKGLSKVLLRRGIPVAWVWCRECKAHTDIVHSHLLFHLPAEHRSGPKLEEMKAHLVRLVDRHGDGIFGEFAVRLVIWPDPDGFYLIKGGGPLVWKQFPRIRKDWRTSQGIIHGKRCGSTENIGKAARIKVAKRCQSTGQSLDIQGLRRIKI
jgi:hypothetical protein